MEIGAATVMGLVAGHTSKYRQIFWLRKEVICIYK